MRVCIVLFAVLAGAVSARGPEDPDAVVFLGPIGKEEGAPSRANLGTRVVLTNVADKKAWSGVLDALRERGFEKVVSFRGTKLGPAFRELRRLEPGFVAVVLPPESLDVNFHFELLERASRLDSDPFVDFAFGYVTGATPAEAEAFLRGALRKKIPRTVLEFGPSEKPHGPTAAAPHKFAEGFKVRRFAHERDAAGVADALRELDGIGIYQAWGHGYPDGVHEGLKGRALRESGLDLGSALYFSGPCYCGVTSGWFANDRGRVEKRTMDLEDSFLLALIKARAGAVFAGLDPDRGETCHHELEHLLMTGAELGMASKSTYDDVVLAYRRPRLELPRYEPGRRDPHRDIHDTMIAGGACRALFGDPAARPLEKAAEDPFAARTRATKEGIEVRWQGGSDLGRYWMPVDVYRAEGRWTHRIRLRADLPVGKGRRLQGMKVLRVTKDGAPVRYVYATGALESWGGSARVHLMVVFPYHPKERVLWGGQKYEATFLLTFARDAADVAPDPADARDGTAMEAAIAANEAILEDGNADLSSLKSLGREGFAAVLALLEAGKGHYRTDRLLHALYYPGAEKEMLALAKGPPLPNYGTWQLLKGLAAADTPEVRDYLVERLENERNPGLFMSAAEALGNLKESRATAAVAARLLRFEEKWRGVEPRLLYALARAAGEEAAPHLAAFLADDRASRTASVETALTLLEGLDRERARRAAAELATSPRMAGFEEGLRAKIEELAR